MPYLDWPIEQAKPHLEGPAVSLPGSNICLDFHGDPARAQLVVFSDGNHHMALEECLQAFLGEHPGAEDVFYATTPPRVLVEAMQSGGLSLGNLRISRMPHVFISPPAVLEKLLRMGALRSHRPFMRNRGSALLVRRGNPKAIQGVADLLRRDVRLFISNPETETVSYEIYAETLTRLAQREGVALVFGEDASGQRPHLVYGRAIHHREAPACLAEDRADVAIVFHHLALRYTRIFPDMFETVTLSRPEDPDNLAAETHIALMGDGGRWGPAAFDFLLGNRAAEIYRRHGLDAATTSRT